MESWAETIERLQAGRAPAATSWEPVIGAGSRSGDNPPRSPVEAELAQWLAAGPAAAAVEARMRDLRARLGKQQALLEQRVQEQRRRSDEAAAASERVYESVRLLERAEEYLRDQAQAAAEGGEGA